MARQELQSKLNEARAEQQEALDRIANAKSARKMWQAAADAKAAREAIADLTAALRIR